MRLPTLAAMIGTMTGFGAAAADGQTPVQAPPTPPQSGRPAADAPTLYVVRYRPGPAYRHDRALLEQDLRAHARYMGEQSEAGTIIAAGPTFEQKGGIVLIRTADLDGALAFVRSDPAVTAGIFVGEVTDWKPFFDPGSRFRGSDNPAD